MTRSTFGRPARIAATVVDFVNRLGFATANLIVAETGNTHVGVNRAINKLIAKKQLKIDTVTPNGSYVYVPACRF